VPKKGLEPPHPCEYMDLNHARLPIPPLRHDTIQREQLDRQQALVYKSGPRCQTRPAYGVFALPADGHLHGNGFQLRQMIQIVTCHRFDEGSKGHLSTLRMQHGL
jgi:hypothetical protein